MYIVVRIVKLVGKILYYINMFYNSNYNVHIYTSYFTHF